MLPVKRSGSPFLLYYQIMMEIWENISSRRWSSGLRLEVPVDNVATIASTFLLTSLPSNAGRANLIVFYTTGGSDDEHR